MSFGWIPRSGIVGSRVNTHVILLDLSKFCSVEVVAVSFPPAASVYLSAHSLSKEFVVSFGISFQSDSENWYLMVAFIFVSLMSETEHLYLYF